MWQRLGALLVAVIFSVGLAAAQAGAQSLREEINQGTVSIVSGGINGTYVRIASDLAAVLDEGNELRVVPMIGKGSVQNIRDILYLQGVDIGIVQSDVLAYFKSQRPQSNIESRIHYITKLYNEELHLLVGPGINSVQDLAGKKVNFGNQGSGTYMTSSILFERLGVRVEPTTFDYGLAAEKVRKGEIAGLMYVVGKPARLFTEAESTQGLKLMQIPQTPQLLDVYLPSRFTSQDYPQLVPQGQTVNTLAVGAVMAVYNWDPELNRFQKVSKFVKAFFDKFNEFQKAPRHPKWREVNLSTEVPGWTRFAPAAEWLANAETASSAQPSLDKTFAKFLAEQAPSLGGDASLDEAKEELFRQYLLWQAKQQTQ